MRIIKKVFSFVIVLSFMLSISVGAFADIALDESGTPTGSSDQWSYSSENNSLSITAGEHKVTGGTFGGSVSVGSEATLISGSFDGEVTNSGTITDGIFNGTVENSGTIEDGSFHYSVESSGTITTGTFYCPVENSGTIEDGTFTGEVCNYDRIEGGEFSNYVYNYDSISGGSYTMMVQNNGSIENGTFSKYVYNADTIEGGSFTGTVNNIGSIEGGSFTGEVRNLSDGSITGSITGGTFSDYPVDNQGNPIRPGENGFQFSLSGTGSAADSTALRSVAVDQDEKLVVVPMGSVAIVWDDALSALLADREPGTLTIDCRGLGITGLSFSQAGIDMLIEAIATGTLEILFDDGTVTLSSSDLSSLTPAPTGRIIISC